MKHTLVVFKKVHDDTPYDHAHPGEGLKFVRNEAEFACFLQSFCRAFKHSAEEIKDYLLIDAVFVSPYYVCTNDACDERKNRVVRVE